MRRDIELEATIAEKFAVVESLLDERGRRLWCAAESRAIGFGGDALVSDATGVSRPTIRTGVKTTDAEMDVLSLHRNEFQGKWNYELRPRVT
ncbi:MAG: hypothetical protein ACI9W2_004955 [Gammaproteobacteria bacterium]|jgi:hypothetical protein